MKIVVYQCEWCGAQDKPRDTGYSGSEEWPDGWSNLDELGNEELLCRDCLREAKLAIATAITKTRTERRSTQALPSKGATEK